MSEQPWDRVAREHRMYEQGIGGPCNCPTCQAARYIATLTPSPASPTPEPVDSPCPHARPSWRMCPHCTGNDGSTTCGKNYGALPAMCRRRAGHDGDCGPGDEREQVEAAFRQARERVRNLAEKERQSEGRTTEMDNIRFRAPATPAPCPNCGREYCHCP